MVEPEERKTKQTYKVPSRKFINQMEHREIPDETESAAMALQEQPNQISKLLEADLPAKKESAPSNVLINLVKSSESL